MYISGILGAKSPGRIEPNFCGRRSLISDVITCFKLGDDRLRGLASVAIPIDYDGRPYNTLTLPCERVMSDRDTQRDERTDGHCDNICSTYSIAPLKNL